MGRMWKKGLSKMLLVWLVVAWLWSSPSRAFFLYRADSYGELLKILAYNLSLRETNFAVYLFYRADPLFEVERALEDLKCLAPYDYWHLQGSAFSSEGNVVTLWLIYRTTYQEEQRLLSYLRVLAAPWRDLPLLERIKTVHDWIVEHVEYDLTLSRYTAYEAFFERRAVCQGYSLLTLRLLSLLGVESGLVDGFGQNQNHLWNMVKLCCGSRCQWFHLDTTWDDPLPGGTIRYDYFLLSDFEILRDHTIYDSCGREAPLSLPEWLSLCETYINRLELKINGREEHLVLYSKDDLRLSVTLEALLAAPADYFLWVKIPGGDCFCFRLPGRWEACDCESPLPAYQGPLLTLHDLPLFEIPCADLPEGVYRIFWAVDTKANGLLDDSRTQTEITFERR